MQYVKFCPRCAGLFWNPYRPNITDYERGALDKEISEKYYHFDTIAFNAYESNICDNCNVELIETEINVEEYISAIQYSRNGTTGERRIKDYNTYGKINRAILDKYIKPVGQLNKSSKKYLQNMSKLYGYTIGVVFSYADAPPYLQECIQSYLRNGIQCPACGSTRLGELEFGQFECKSCGYKW